ncbi:MAG: helix-turn-helix domain-containing protein [Desulfobulbaceae bacterium]|nr:helix-turn-helix domain-containing protein [Desulfobulbaceae bacterium]
MPELTPTPAPSTTPLAMRDVKAAPLLNMSVHTLRKMRSQGRGPAYIKADKTVLYRLSDLEAYLEKQLVTR